MNMALGIDEMWFMAAFWSAINVSLSSGLGHIYLNLIYSLALSGCLIVSPIVNACASLLLCTFRITVPLSFYVLEWNMAFSSAWIIASRTEKIAKGLDCVLSNSFSGSFVFYLVQSHLRYNLFLCRSFWELPVGLWVSGSRVCSGWQRILPC